MAYGAAKAALNMVTRNLAPEFAPKVRVNAISVGGVATDSLDVVLTDEHLRAQFLAGTPMGRPGTVEDIAACALYLASPASGWVTGKILQVDGGTEAPSITIPAPLPLTGTPASHRARTPGSPVPWTPRGRARRSPGSSRSPGRPGPVRGPVPHRLRRRPRRRGGHQRHGQVDAAADRGRRRPPRRRVRSGGVAGSRVGFLEQVPEPAARARCAPAVGAGWEAEAALDRLGMPVLGRRRRGHPLGRPGQAGGAGPGAGPPGRAARPRRAHQPSRPGRGGLARAAAARLPRRPGPGHPRPPSARPGHHPDARARPGPHLRARGRVRRPTWRPRPSARSRRPSAEATRRNLARRELAWLRRGAQARSRKPQARIDAAMPAHRGRARTPPARATELELAGITPRLGDKVDRVHRRRASATATVPWSCPASTSPSAAASGWASSGPTGPGKSTLVDLLAGRRSPRTGTVEVGPTVVVGYYDQQGTELDLGGPGAGPGGRAPPRPGSLADVEL